MTVSPNAIHEKFARPACLTGSYRPADKVSHIEISKDFCLVARFCLAHDFLVTGVTLKQEGQIENTATISGSYSSKRKMHDEFTRIVQSDFRGTAWSHAMALLETGAKFRFDISC
jgi:hypothetical protein